MGTFRLNQDDSIATNTGNGHRKVGRESHQVGQAIKDTRIELGITRKELAMAMGIVPAHVSRLENNGTKPTMSTLEKVAKALGKKLYFYFD